MSANAEHEGNKFVMTDEIGIRLLETVDHGLCSGLGSPKPGHMCVEAAVCYSMGHEHSDEPPCVDKMLRYMKIELNDMHGIWTSKTDRAKGLRDLAVAQLGTKEVFTENASLKTKEFDKLVEQLVKSLIFDKAKKQLAELEPEQNDSDYFAPTEKIRRAAKNLIHFFTRKHRASAIQEKFLDYITLKNVMPSPKARRKLVDQYIAGLVKILIKLKAPGALWLAKNKSKYTPAQIAAKKKSAQKRRKELLEKQLKLNSEMNMIDAILGIRKKAFVESLD